MIDCRICNKLLNRYDFQSDVWAKEMEAHCRACPPCQQEFLLYQSVDAELKQAFREEPPARLWEGFWAELARKLRGRSWREKVGDQLESVWLWLNRPVVGFVPAYALAALLVLALSVGLITRSGRPGFQSDLVVHPQQSVSAEVVDGVTVYQIASR